jgi:hypothetical protein
MLVGNILKDKGEQATAVFPLETAHDCSQFTVLTAEEEIVCMRCGRVCEEEMAEYLHEMGIVGDDAKAYTLTDHNAGNGLLNSETVQNGYVSRKNAGVAFVLNNPRGKDAQGKHIKPQLRDPYKAGLVGDPSKGCHVEEDILTGKTAVKFSRYDLPTLQLIKERALKRCVDLHLDTIEQTKVAKELKRIYSNLFLCEMIDYAVLTALLKNNQSITKPQQKELERELAKCIEAIRDKVLSGCATGTTKKTN